ncbi:MAG: mechanosensitive ion channel family protein [Pseudomonadota bacterium]
MRKRSGELVLLPNSFLFKNPVEIQTDRKWPRISTVVGVAYSENVDTSRDVIQKAVEELETVADQPVQVFATEFNSSSIDFMVRWWTESTPIGEHRSRDQVVVTIKAALDDAGIEIRFPYRPLNCNEPLKSKTARPRGRSAHH